MNCNINLTLTVGPSGIYNDTINISQRDNSDYWHGRYTRYRNNGKGWHWTDPNWNSREKSQVRK